VKRRVDIATTNDDNSIFEGLDLAGDQRRKPHGRTRFDDQLMFGPGEADRLFHLCVAY